MAVDAELHIQIKGLDRLHRLAHLAMAGRALHPRSKVALVREDDMIGHFIEANPRDLLTSLGIAPDLLLLGAVCEGRSMASHTGIHVRNGGPSIILHPFVTELTLQEDGVLDVREGYGLSHWGCCGSVGDQKGPAKDQDQQTDEEG